MASLVATLKDATARAAASAKIVVLGHLEASRGSDKSLTAVGKFTAALAEARSARAALAELGLKAASDAVPVDALSEKLDITGATRVHAAFRSLRECEALVPPGYPTERETKEHQSRAAAPIVARIEAMGFGEFIDTVRPTSRAHGVTPAVTPHSAGFTNVGTQGL